MSRKHSATSNVDQWSLASISRRHCFPLFLIVASLLITCASAAAQSTRRPAAPANRYQTRDKSANLKDAFYEDNSFVVRIRTTYNNTSSITCNAVLMDEQLVLSDITCIKYQAMANIDARYVHVLDGEPGNETEYEVEQIYLNKADLRDPTTELALLKLHKPLRIDSQCRHLTKPESHTIVESESNVRVIGYSRDFELKESRLRSSRRNRTDKYICTEPNPVGDSPGNFLLKGAPLLHMIDCRQYQIVGILAKTEVFMETSPVARKQHDCYVVVALQRRWFDQVKSLTSLKAKNDGVTQEPNWWQPIVVTVEPELI